MERTHQEIARDPLKSIRGYRTWRSIPMDSTNINIDLLQDILDRPLAVIPVRSSSQRVIDRLPRPGNFVLARLN